MNHKERREEALTSARGIIENAKRSERALTSEESQQIEANLSDARYAAAAIDAADAGRAYAKIFNSAPSRDEYRGGSWIANELRTLSPTSGAGTAIDNTKFADFVLGNLSAASAFLASGVNQIVLGDAEGQSLTIPTITADYTTANYSAAGTISASDPTIAQTVATPRKFGALGAISNEVLNDANPAALDALAASLVKSVGNSFDLAAFEGSGTAPAITGLQNVSNINEVSMGTNGASLTNLDPFADAIGEITLDNANAGAIVVGARTYKALLKLKTLTSGANEPLLLAGGTQAGAGAAVPMSIYGVPVYVSTQLSAAETQGTATTAQSAYVYDPRALHAVFRRARGSQTLVAVERDSSRLFNLDTSEIRGILRATVAVPFPGAVARIKGILA